MTTMLKVQNLHTSYGPIKALRGIELDVQKGEIVTIIGSNGAGKSTLLMSICGILTPSAGDIFYEGRNIAGRQAYHIMNQGIAQVPEGRRIFPHMSVQENLQMGAQQCEGGAHYQKDMERVHAMFPVLKERSHQSGGTLSGGEQQMLAMARALMSRPRLLLLDEPSLGLAPIISKQIFDIIHRINEEGTTILLVEQNAFAALNLAQRGFVLSTGSIVMTGEAKKLLEDPQVKAAYLGM